MPTTVQKPPLVIGLTGPIGSGVSTVGRVLESQGFIRVALSTPIKKVFREKYGLSDAADIRSVADWRKKLQDIGDEGRDPARGGHPCRWLEAAVEGVPADANLVIDGVRNAGEVLCLRERYTRSFLLAVVADRPTRWERCKDDYKKHEADFERDDKRDSVDKDDLPYGQQVERCVLAADYILNNDPHVAPRDRCTATLKEMLSSPVGLMRGETKENPKEGECYMAAAYALSHRSRCLKRHVGAVIVDEDGIVLASGFNENPVGMQPCLVAFNNSCHKDNLMQISLEKLRDFYCPQCGDRIASVEKPWKCPRCGDDLKRRFFPSRNMEYCTALHAEDRAVKNLQGRPARGAAMYVTTFPCLQCARYIVDAGVQKVVYVEAYPVKESLAYFKLNKVTVEPFGGFMARAFNLVFRQVD